MALDPTSVNPCSLLSTSGGLSNLFIQSTLAPNLAYPLIVNGGVLATYANALNGVAPFTGASSVVAALSSDILAAPSTSSTLRLVQFLSGGGSGAADISKRYNQLSFVALSATPGTGPYESIIDTYVVGAAPKGLGLGLGSSPTNYNPINLSATKTSLLTPAQFWVSGDANTDGTVKASATSLLGKLINAKYLLSQGEIYMPSQVVPTAGSTTTPPAAGSESLVYLYRLSQSGKVLNSAQSALKTKLEATNLRFFGAFMAEYCFYRTRYEMLLRHYFTVYTTSTTSYSASGSASAYPFLIGAGFTPAGSTSTTSSLTQADNLNALAFHMASLNMRLADMRTLLATINTYYNGVFTQIQGEINSASEDGSNSSLTTAITALQSSASTANKYLTEQDFAQEAMTYNSEKNRYSNILLGLYAFLNLSALATVFHLARN